MLELPNPLSVSYDWFLIRSRDDVTCALQPLMLIDVCSVAACAIPVTDSSDVLLPIQFGVDPGAVAMETAHESTPTTEFGQSDYMHVIHQYLDIVQVRFVCHAHCHFYCCYCCTTTATGNSNYNNHYSFYSALGISLLLIRCCCCRQFECRLTVELNSI